MYVYLILSNIGNKPLFQWRRRICRSRCLAGRCLSVHCDLMSDSFVMSDPIRYSCTHAPHAPQTKPAQGNGERRCTERAIQGPTLHRTGHITGKWRASVPGNGNPGTDAGINLEPGRDREHQHMGPSSSRTVTEGGRTVGGRSEGRRTVRGPEARRAVGRSDGQWRGRSETMPS